MSPELVDMLLPSQPGHRIWGVVTGVVSDNADPLGLARVKVGFPWLADGAVTSWARLTTPMAGPSRGIYTVPEVGDEVLVAFEHGNPDYPYVLGALWNSNDSPPESGNDHRSITSRSGHVVRLDDTSGDERIEIIDSTGNNTIVIAVKDNSIEITADGDITIASSSGKVTLQAMDVEIKADDSIKVEATGSLELSCDAETAIKGEPVAIN